MGRLTHLALLEQFKLGFADRTLSSLLLDGETRQGASIRGLLQRKGILKPNGRELFLGALIIPVFNENDELLNVYGHRISKYVRQGSTVELIASPTACFFNQKELTHYKQVVLCDNPIDALSLYSLGLKNVVSLLGNSFSEHHLMLFKAAMVSSVILVFPNTLKGNNDVQSIVRRLGAASIRWCEYRLPKGECVNSVLVKPQALPLLLEWVSVTKESQSHA